MNFIGIDQSMRHTGVCLLSKHDEPKLWLIEPEHKGPVLLGYIFDRIAGILDVTTPVAAAVEGGSFGSRGRLFDLGEVHGVVMLALLQARTSIVDVAPSQLKKFQTGKSGARKEWMVEAANDFLGYEIDDDNLADAVGLARIARAVHLQDATTRAEAEVVHKLTNSDRYYKL
jgi:Holliday junction resolvasome RuvABC endonuclease subunit